jgi:hypothetical protein
VNGDSRATKTAEHGESEDQGEPFHWQFEPVHPSAWAGVAVR